MMNDEILTGPRTQRKRISSKNVEGDSDSAGTFSSPLCFCRNRKVNLNFFLLTYDFLFSHCAASTPVFLRGLSSRRLLDSESDYSPFKSALFLSFRSALHWLSVFERLSSARSQLQQHVIAPQIGSIEFIDVNFALPIDSSLIFSSVSSSVSSLIYSLPSLSCRQPMELGPLVKMNVNQPFRPFAH